RQSYLGITSGIAQVRALQAAVVSTGSQLESTRLGQTVGVRTQVDVLNAQQLLFSASRDLARSKYDYILSLLRLEAAIGELTEDDLVAVNQWLDRNASGPSRRPDMPFAPAAVPPPEIASAAPPPQPDARVVESETAKPAPLSPREDSADVLRTLDAWARAW